MPPQKVQAFTFFVSMGASYVQVAQYQGRSFLRDGYHRAAGLLHVGVSRVPAVVIDAPSFQFITSAPGLFDHEVAFSDRAPRLADFWDDSVSADALQPAVRMVVRIRLKSSSSRDRTRKPFQPALAPASLRRKPTVSS